jgi:hypothetical protein
MKLSSSGFDLSFMEVGNLLAQAVYKPQVNEQTVASNPEQTGRIASPSASPYTIENSACVRCCLEMEGFQFPASRKLLRSFETGVLKFEGKLPIAVNRTNRVDLIAIQRPIELLTKRGGQSEATKRNVRREVTKRIEENMGKGCHHQN